MLENIIKPEKKEEYIYRETHLCVSMKTARIDIKEEDFDIKHKTKSQYNGSYTPKSMILGGWDVGGKKILEAFHSPQLRA